MAEKYGTVPPKWTRAWWEYFWDYYKLHVIITVFAVIFIAVTVVQCATKEKYDLTITNTGHIIYTEEELEHMEEVYSGLIDDVDGNGEKSVFVQQINFMNKSGSEEYDYASQTKLDVEFSNECSFLFTFDSSELDNALNRNGASDLYMPVGEWAEIMPSEDKLVSLDGVPYAVKLDGSAFMTENDLYCTDMYLIVRKNYRNDEKNNLAHQNSVKIANTLIK